MRTALSNSCKDLQRAEAVYRSLERERLLRVIFAQPGSLMASDTPTGYELSVTRSTMMLGYADLGAGMVEMAERANEFSGMGVSVNATGPVTPNPGVIVQYFISGLLAHICPWAWQHARRYWGAVLAGVQSGSQKRIEA